MTIASRKSLRGEIQGCVLPISDPACRHLSLEIDSVKVHGVHHQAVLKVFTSIQALLLTKARLCYLLQAATSAFACFPTPVRRREWAFPIHTRVNKGRRAHPSLVKQVQDRLILQLDGFLLERLCLVHRGVLILLQH